MVKNWEECGSCCGLIIVALSWHLHGVTQHNNRDACHSIHVSQPTFELDTSTVEVKGVASEAACQVDLANDWARDKYSFSLSRFGVFRGDLTRHPSLFQTNVLPISPTLKVEEAFSTKYQYPPAKLQGMTYHKTWDTQILAARSPKFYTLMPNICGSSVWNMLHVTLLRPRILRWLLEFWQICENPCRRL